MTQENLRQLAKQGNPKAIAALINQSLKPKNITAKVGLKDDCLQVLLESAQIPKQQAMVSFMRNGLTKLEVESIKTVKVFGRQVGEESPAWSQSFEMVSEVETPSFPEPIELETPLSSEEIELETPSRTQEIDFQNLSAYQTARSKPSSIPSTAETPSSTGQTDRQNLRGTPAMSQSQNSSQTSGFLSVGNVVSAGLRIYRDRFKLYLGLAFKALLWSFVPIYGWAKNFQIQGIISRHVFQELTNQPESIGTTRTQLAPQLWSFWVAQILIALIAFAVNIALTIVSVIILGILTAVLGGTSSSEGGLFIVLIQNIINLITLAIYLWFYSHFFIAELPLAIERNVTSTSCISRSWELTKGLALRVQMIVLVAGLITAPIVLLALSPVFFMISSLITSFSPEALVSTIISIIFWGLILVTVGSTLMMPFWQAIKAVVYYDLRSRREGLGLQVRDSRSR
jgi:hypothetical protein